MSLGANDSPHKAVSAWNTKRLVFCGILCFAFIVTVTCAVIGMTLSAILAFALFVISFYELQMENFSEKKSQEERGVDSQIRNGNVSQLSNILSRTKVEALSLDSWVANPSSHAANKVLLKSLIKEYLEVVRRLQKYEPEYGTGGENDPCVSVMSKKKDKDSSPKKSNKDKEDASASPKKGNPARDDDDEMIPPSTMKSEKNSPKKSERGSPDRPKKVSVEEEQDDNVGPGENVGPDDVAIDIIGLVDNEDDNTGEDMADDKENAPPSGGGKEKKDKKEKKEKKDKKEKKRKDKKDGDD